MKNGLNGKPKMEVLKLKWQRRPLNRWFAMICGPRGSGYD